MGEKNTGNVGKIKRKVSPCLRKASKEAQKKGKQNRLPSWKIKNQFTTLSAQQLLAKASGLALKAKPIPKI